MYVDNFFNIYIFIIIIIIIIISKSEVKHMWHNLKQKHVKISKYNF